MVRRRWHSAQSNLVEHARAINVTRVTDSTADPAGEVARIGRRTEVYLETPPRWTAALLTELATPRRAC